VTLRLVSRSIFDVLPDYGPKREKFSGVSGFVPILSLRHRQSSNAFSRPVRRFDAQHDGGAVRFLPSFIFCDCKLIHVGDVDATVKRHQNKNRLQQGSDLMGFKSLQIHLLTQ